MRFERLTEQEKYELVKKETPYYHIKTPFFSNKGNRLLVLAFALLVLLVIAGKCFYPYDAVQIDDGAIQQGPGALHWLGTNQIGQDVLAQLLDGLIISLIISFFVAVLSASFGTLYGMISGYFGGTVDLVMFRLIEIINSIPAMLWIFLLSAILSKGLGTMVFVLSICAWSSTAFLVRSRILEIKGQDFILGTQAMGASTWWMIGKHLLPNSLSVVLVQVVILIPNAIFAEAMLSYVGLGVQAPMVSLGVLLSAGTKYIAVAPYQLLACSITMVILVSLFHLLGESLKKTFIL